MAMVAGRPFVTYLLDQLAVSGIQKVVLCTGYLADMIREELGDTFHGMELLYSVEQAPLGTGGALRHAVGLLSGEMILVLNGDSYCRCGLAEFIDGHAASGADAGMALVQVDNVSRFGAVVTNEASLVEDFVEKGSRTGAGWINAGIYLVPIRMIQEIGPNLQISLELEVFPALIAKGLYGHPCTGPFIDIGIPDEFKRAQSFFSIELKGKT
jgi:D-glycero-alpha-D-manno-heptose 1-phosphate guanylyltransferase